MEIHFKVAHSPEIEREVTEEITNRAEKKLIALKKYLGKKDEVAQVYVELGKISEAHQNGDVWRTQINLDCDGKRYHSAAVAEQQQASIDSATHELEAELRKAKNKSEGMLRRGGGILKSLARGFRSSEI